MNVLIVEDEILAAERIQALLLECDPEAVVVEQVDSVEDTVNFFKTGKHVDLLFLDIQLADGKSFEIFEKVNIDVPIIFTTAYDQYAIRAFKFHSIDYLLKPVQYEELQQALSKLKRLSNASTSIDINTLKKILLESPKHYKERFVIKVGNKLQYKQTTDVAYFFAEGKEAYLVTKSENRKFLIDQTLEELEGVLNPEIFFRISRKFIVNIDSILEVRGLSSLGMEVKLKQGTEHSLVVSRERAQKLKKWLDR